MLPRMHCKIVTTLPTGGGSNSHHYDCSTVRLFTLCPRLCRQIFKSILAPMEICSGYLL